MGTTPRMDSDMASQPIRVLIVDDHAIVRKSLKALLDECENIIVIGEATDGMQAIELVETLKPDITLVDLFMPGMDGIETIKRILVLQPDQRIIVVSAAFENERVVAAIRAGALGYVKKDARPEELLISIERAFVGQPSIDPAVLMKVLKNIHPDEKYKLFGIQLTEREEQVILLIAKGYTDNEIAKQLVIAKVTIRTHVSRILSKLGLINRVQIALYALRAGLVNAIEFESR